MKNKKGFTLIELLAVIVILAIIALIATPIILNMINKAKKNAARSSALGYVDAIEYNNGLSQVDPDNYTAVASGDVSEIDVNLKGKKPVSGTVTIDSNGKVESATLCINGYNVTYENNDATVGTTCSGGGSSEPSEPVASPQSFADDSWATIAANTTSDVYKVRDTKCVALTGLTTTNNNECENGEFKVRIANKTACKTETSQTACGFVVEFTDVVARYNMNSTATNEGGYPASELYQEFFASNAANSLYAKLPSDLQSKIINTKVVSGHGSKSGETNFTSQDKLYLFSIKEVGIASSNDTANSETRILDYYNAHNDDVARTKRYNNGEESWWLRSPGSDTSDIFYRVFLDGSFNYLRATFSVGFSPAFRIGS